MTRDQFIIKCTNMLRLTFGISAMKAKVFADSLARSTNCFSFTDKPKYTEDQLSILTDVWHCAAEMAHPDAGVKAMKTPEGELVVVIPMGRWKALADALNGRKHQEHIDEQKRKAREPHLVDAAGERVDSSAFASAACDPEGPPTL